MPPQPIVGIGLGMTTSGLPLDRIGIWAGLRAGSGLALAASDQTNEFLRRRDIAAKFAALLRHRATKAHGMFWGFCPALRRRTGFAGRGRTANIDVATAHD
jgi:hypothetical protein